MTGSKHFLKRKEEDEATSLVEEMRKNVEAAQHKSLEADLEEILSQNEVNGRCRQDDKTVDTGRR